MTGTGDESNQQADQTPGATQAEDRLAIEWRAVVADLQVSQRAWLRSSKAVHLHGTTAIVAVPDDFTRKRLEGRHRTELEGALSERFGHEIQLAVTVDTSLEHPDDREVAAGVPEAAPVADEPLTPLEDRLGDLSTNRPVDLSTLTQNIVSPPAAAPTGESRLNPKYTFDTFVIGSSNRFPHAAAVAVSEAPGRSYNPLLVYGESGLGKTHLLHAIGHYVRTIYAGSKVRYVSSEEFTNEFINSIRDDRPDRFKRKYRDVDVLLIDDIQFLEGKEQTQEEFFHTFNALHNANKQIVLTSDRSPKRLEALEDRLRNRFEWGLITDVQPPDLETRIAILRKKAAMDRLTAPSDVLEFIASKIQTNIRELEGALIRVTAFANLNRQDVDMTLAEIVLKDLIPEGGEPEITAGLIIAQTANYFGLTIDEITGPSRGRHLVMARQIAMHLCRELTNDSLPRIGKHFGGRDHTTVMYAERKINQLLGERRAVFNQVSELTNRIKMTARQA
ncbi:hypothetical protein GCM10028772_01170 [Nocardioides ultimimeridianus]